jgi:hypothetical protein
VRKVPVFQRYRLHSRSESSAIYEQLNAAERRDAWVVSREMQANTVDQLPAFHQVTCGPATFSFRCGGGSGPLHRAVISPSGQLSFPDHVDGGNTEIADVLRTISGARTAPTCADFLKTLRGPPTKEKPRHVQLLDLWHGRYSDMPPWAQAFVKAVRLREYLEERNNPTGSFEVALQQAASLEIAQDGETLDWLGIKGIVFYEGDECEVFGDKPEEWSWMNHDNTEMFMPWPEGYATYLTCRFRARHGDHEDLVLTMRSERSVTTGNVVCSQGWRRHTEGQLAVGVRLARTLDGWAVTSDERAFAHDFEAKAHATT